MQLTLPFTVLLASVLALYSAPTQVDAHPLAQTRAPNGRITLPLMRVARRQDGLHPEVYLQQHINRAHKRYARMTGREEPSRAGLERALQKRVDSLEKRGLQARSYRMGHAAAGLADVAKPVSNKQASSTSLGDVIAALTGGNKNKAKGNKAKGAAAGAAAGGAAAGAAAGGAAGAGTAAGGAAGAAASATASAAAAAESGTNSGFSEIDLQAEEADSLAVANTPTTNDTVGLDIEANDVGYLATVQLGTPPQNFNVIMDSGSADFWVGSESCQSEGGGNCGNHTFLGTQSSSSFQDSGKQFQVTYGSGEVSGTIVQDNLVMAGLSLNAHTFGVADVESVQFSGDPNTDGLMGLAQSTLSEQQVPTPVESLASAGLISDAITSFKISRLADQLNDGEVTFGALDTSKFDQSTLTTVDNVNQQGFWESNVDAFSVDGQDSGLTGRTAILDTGTTLIIAPPQDAATVMSMIPGAASDGQGGFTVPCTTNASLALTIGGTAFAIDSRDLAFAPVNNNDLTGDCTAGISSGQIGGANEWLVGDVFLKNAYFSVDTGKNQISLAKLT